MCCSVGRPKHVRLMAGALEGSTFIGPKAEARNVVSCLWRVRDPSVVNTNETEFLVVMVM